MATNTIRHVSDDSVYKIFNPAGTAFPASVTNVQAALAAIKAQAVNGIPNASQTVIGISRFATQTEVDTGTLTDVGVSPATLKSAITRPPATTTVSGLTRYATSPETVTGTISNAAVVPSGLKAALTSTKTEILATQATELAMGVTKISTEPAALAGTDDKTTMTPKKVALAIAKATAALPTYSDATSSNTGLVRLATAGEVQAGTLGNAVAVTPATLKTLTSTSGRAGLIQLASTTDVANGADATKAITPQTLLARTGGIGRLGLVKLTSIVGQASEPATALAYDADVVHLRGGQHISGNLSIGGQINTGSLYCSGALNVEGSLTKNGRQVVTTDMLVDEVPVGAIMMWPSNAGLPGKWHDADGWSGYIGHPSYGALQSVYPNGLPDMRGLFVRGAYTGGHILGQRGTDYKGKPMLGNGCDGAGPGQVQAQQVRKHKHNSGWGERHSRTDAYFGATARAGYYGNYKRDGDNYLYFTNDGSEIEDTDAFGTMNTVGLIGEENRPWNMSVRYIVKIL